MVCGEQMPPVERRERQIVVAGVGALGFSCVMTQLALLRELLGAFSGNEMVLGIALGLWLLLMGLGSRLGRISDKFRRPLAVFAAAQIALAVLPLLQVFLLRVLRNVVFIRGAEVGLTETVVAAFVLLLPYCLVAGFTLALACAILARSTGPAGIGHVYVADSLGGILGGILFSFVLVRSCDHLSILRWPAWLNLAAAIALGLQARSSRFRIQGSRFAPGWLAALALVLGLGLIATTAVFDLDALSTALQYPRQRIVARANSPYGKLLVTESAGQFDFIQNGIPVISTRDDQHVEETVHYAMAQRPDAHKVLLVAGGISGTAREILKYPARQVDYVELDPLILTFGKRYLPGNLADPRIHVINTDGRLFIKQTSEKYDVAIIDIPAPSTAQLNRFYTVECLAQIKRVLTSEGVVSFSLGDYENYVSRDLARMLASARLSAKAAFRNVLVLPGSRVFFLASDGPLFEDIAARLEQHRITTRLVGHHYLDAMLMPDRLADIARATAQPAALNRDFSPVLYYYHLRHWMSQFHDGFGPVQIALLGLLALYLARLRGSALVLFASGFAASALEMVLLLGFQVLCGSVYHQVGIIVTVFMLGLALGAWWVNRSSSRSSRRQEALLSPATQGKHWNSGTLALLALLIAVYAAVLPFLLPLLNRAGGSGSLVPIKTAIALLTLVLALLVGMQFPVANRLEFDGTVAAASRLYTADFVGACLGALLASTLLIPLIGVAGVCLLTAVLNLLAGAGIRFRKAVI